MQPTPVHPRQIIGLVLKYRWFVIFPFCLSMLAGIYLALTLPRKYQAQTLILIQPQKVPSNYVQSIVTDDIDSRISTLSQQILSRTNLEKIMEELKLFSGPKFKNMFTEDKIANLRERIKVQVTRDRRRDADAFTISFVGEVPLQVMQVVNTLSTYFIDENLKTRETQAIGTSGFLEEEVVSIRNHLEELEEGLKQYRERNMGALPEQLETNLRILDRLQVQMSLKQQALIDAKNRLAVVEKQISTEDTLQHDDVKQRRQINNDQVNSQLQQLDAMKTKLMDLKARYTDRHPDVIRLENEITKFESNIGKNVEAPAERIPSLAENQMDLIQARQREAQLKQLTEYKLEIAGLNNEIKKLADQLKYYQKRVEDTPKREQELLSLQRDYQNVKQTYDSLLNRKLEAQIALNMERKQKGEQFRVVDPARLPQKPIKPDMKKIFLLAVAAGLGIGGGLIFVREYYDASFKKIEDIESYLELPVLATVPALVHPGGAKWSRVNMVLSSIFTIISIGLFAVLAVITIKGIDQSLELFNRFITI